MESVIGNPRILQLRMAKLTDGLPAKQIKPVILGLHLAAEPLKYFGCLRQEIQALGIGLPIIDLDGCFEMPGIPWQGRMRYRLVEANDSCKLSYRQSMSC